MGMKEMMEKLREASIRAILESEVWILSRPYG